MEDFKNCGIVLGIIVENVWVETVINYLSHNWFKWTDSGWIKIFLILVFDRFFYNQNTGEFNFEETYSSITYEPFMNQL